MPAPSLESFPNKISEPPADSVATLGRVVDEVVVLQTPPWLLSIGEHYEDFTQVSDDEVMACLRPNATQVPRGAAEVPSPA